MTNAIVAVGENSGSTESAVYSTNAGSSWAAFSTPLDGGTGSGIAFGNGQILVLGSVSSTGVVATSSNGGTSWSSHDPWGTDGNGNAALWNGSLWVAVGQAPVSGNAIYTSTDGLTWIGRSSGLDPGYALAVAWNGTHWIVVGSDNVPSLSTVVSTNGTSWSTLTTPFDTGYGSGVVWNSSASVWVVVGSDSGPTNAIMTNPNADGSGSWTEQSSPFDGGYGAGIAWNGSLYVCAGQNSGSDESLISATSASATWTYRSSDLDSAPNGAVCAAWDSADNIWLAGAAPQTGSDTVLVSGNSTATSWSDLTTGFEGGAINAVSYGNITVSSVSAISYHATSAYGAAYASQFTVSLPVNPVDPNEPGYGFLGRSRGATGLPIVTPPVAPPPPLPSGASVTVPISVIEIPTSTEVMPTPYVVNGLPYTNSASVGVDLTPWLPLANVYGTFGHLQIVVNGSDVTYFRGVPTLVQSWASQEPFGDASAVILFPNATSFDNLPIPQTVLSGEVVGIAATYTGLGYWQASTLGYLATYGDAANLILDLGQLNAEVSGITATPPSAGDPGYGVALCARDGGVFCTGDMVYKGNNLAAPDPIVGIAAMTAGSTNTEGGYWIVTSGQTGTFYVYQCSGTASSYSTTTVGSHSLASEDEVVGIARINDSDGIAVISGQGYLYYFGTITGSPPSRITPTDDITMNGIGGDPTGEGFVAVDQFGVSYPWGSAPTPTWFSPGALVQPTNSVAIPITESGYWLSAGDGGVFAYGAPYYGSVPGGGYLPPSGPGMSSVSWLRLGSTVNINVLIGDTVQDILFQGIIQSWEDQVGGETIGITVNCVGALFQLDWYIAKPIVDLPFVGYNVNDGTPLFGWDVGMAISQAIKSAIYNPAQGTALGSYGISPPQSQTCLYLNECNAVDTGVLTLQRGSWDKLLTSYIQNILAQAQEVGGQQYTLTLQHGAPPTPIIGLKDFNSIDYIVATGQNGVAHNLSMDISTAANAIYMQGISPTVFSNPGNTGANITGIQGSWQGQKFPQYYIGSAPTFPAGAEDYFSPGSEESGLPPYTPENGYDFSPFSDWMRQNGWNLVSQKSYLANDPANGVNDQALIQAFQSMSGVTTNTNGFVDEPTWNKAFMSGYSEGSNQNVWYAPLAELPEVDPYLWSTGGSFLGNNPAFQPRLPRVERFENVGQGVSKAQGVASAAIELARTQVPSWIGTITLTADPMAVYDSIRVTTTANSTTLDAVSAGQFVDLEPEWVVAAPGIPGSPTATYIESIAGGDSSLTMTQEATGSATVTAVFGYSISRFMITAGQNIMMNFWHGKDTLFHISAVSIDWPNQSVQLTVSSQPTDLMTLAAIYARDSSTFGVARQARPSLVNLNISNNTVVFDSESGAGMVPPTILQTGWNVIRVPFAETGSVAEVNLTTGFPATPFAVGVFSGPVTVVELTFLFGDLGCLDGNPLLDDTAGNNPWNDGAVALDNLGLLYGAGGPEGPCGYYPSDPNGVQVLSGQYLDANTWPFAPAPTYSPYLWVAFWASNDCIVTGQFLIAPPPSG